MYGEYASLGGDGLSGALADLNDAFGDLSGFGEIAEGAVKMAVPVLIGGGVTFGTVAALDYFITDAETKASIEPYKWLIGAGVGTIAGVIIWKTKLGPAAGVVTIAASLMLAAVTWGYAKLNEVPVAALPATTPASTGRLGAYRYSVNPFKQGDLGAYRMGSPKGALFGTPAAYGNVVM